MKLKVILLSLYTSQWMSAQIISGKIINNENNRPIPYARIGVEGEKMGSLTDEKGNYKIDLTNIDRSKKVTVQLGGYTPFEKSIQSFLNAPSHDIKLLEKVKDIEEVKITPKSYEYKNWGINSKAKNTGFWYSSEGTAEGNWVQEIAVAISNKKKVKIEKINLNINQFDTDKPVLFNFNVYAKEGNRPGKSILSEVLTGEVTKDKIIDGTFSFDIKDKSIWVDNEDFYVAVQIVSSYKGKIGFSAALLSSVYIRSYYDKWEKIPIAAPAINIDVKVQKEKRK